MYRFWGSAPAHVNRQRAYKKTGVSCKAARVRVHGATYIEDSCTDDALAELPPDGSVVRNEEPLQRRDGV